MARYELQRWVSGKGFAIRDTLEEVYIRDWQGNVSALSLGDQTDRCYRMNQLVRQREEARARFIAWNGSDEGFDDGYDADEAQERYEAEWDRQEREYEGYCDAMGYDPREYVDAVDYVNQYM